MHFDRMLKSSLLRLRKFFRTRQFVSLAAKFRTFFYPPHFLDGIAMKSRVNLREQSNELKYAENIRCKTRVAQIVDDDVMQRRNEVNE